MSKAYLGTFVTMAVLAAGTVDYINQAKAAGSVPGRFGIGAYAASIEDRVIGQRQVTAAARPGADTPIAAPSGAAVGPNAPVSAGGGLVGSILGAIGFGGGAPTMIADRPIMPAKAKSAVKVNAVGAGSCTRTGIGKRCKIGG